MSDDPIITLDRGKGLHLVLYPNRLVVTDGVLFAKKENTIPLKSVASVQYDRLGYLHLETSGGKKYKWALGPKGKDLKAAIEQLL